jgi:hypothetical protein
MMTIDNARRANARNLGFYSRDYEVYPIGTPKILHHPVRRIVYADDRHLAIKLKFATGYLA